MAFHYLTTNPVRNTMQFYVTVLLQSVHSRQRETVTLELINCSQGHLSNVLPLLVDNDNNEHGCHCCSRCITVDNGA